MCLDLLDLKGHYLSHCMPLGISSLYLQFWTKIFQRYFEDLEDQKLAKGHLIKSFACKLDYDQMFLLSYYYEKMGFKGKMLLFHNRCCFQTKKLKNWKSKFARSEGYSYCHAVWFNCLKILCLNYVYLR